MYTAHRFAAIELVFGPGDACNAKVHHPQLAIIQQHDILGLDVPVDDAVAVGMLQRLEDLGDEMHRLPAGQFAPALVQVLAQGHAVHIFHYDVLQLVCDRYIVHFYDIGVIQKRNSLGLVLEPAHQIRVVHQLRAQHLDRYDGALGHRAAGSHCHCFIDIGHTAGADHLLHLVQSIQCFTDQIHRHPPSALYPSAAR